MTTVTMNFPQAFRARSLATMLAEGALKAFPLTLEGMDEFAGVPRVVPEPIKKEVLNLSLEMAALFVLANTSREDLSLQSVVAKTPLKVLQKRFVERLEPVLLVVFHAYAIFLGVGVEANAWDKPPKLT